MKKILIAITLVFFFSCNSNKTEKNKDNSTFSENLLEQNNITIVVSQNHSKIENIKGDFIMLKQYLGQLEKNKVSSIALALDYINTCLPSNVTYQDSVFLLFNMKFYEVANNLSDSLYTKYKLLVEQLNNNSNSREVEIFKDNLKSCGLELCMSEGSYYLDVQSDFFHNSFKNRVSEGLNEYLKIRKDELAQGFSEDAGLLISFDDLYKRVKQWESFLNKYPNTLYSNEANYYYKTYLETLLTGMDNSRVFDYENNILLPQVKSLYENIIKEEPMTESSKIISSYYNFLYRHEFKENDSIGIFLKTKELSSMLGIQPHSR